ncbi:MAG: tRNA pseudouridine(13) synthase TruD [Pseudomonadales bacterium]
MNDSGFSLCFPRARGEPLCRGVIKAEAGDFQVMEQLGFEPAGNGEHAYLKIRKINANTGWVASQLAGLAEVRPFDVGYAGRKDRQAITEQWFSCYLPGRMDPDWRTLASDDIEIVAVTRHRRKLRKGAHRRNLFQVRIREFDGDRADMEARLECIRDNGFPNYFGEQRFGRGGRNLHYAGQLFAGERVSRAKRDIYVSAARAYLFNRVLSDRVVNGYWQSPDEKAALYGITKKGSPDPEPAGYEAWCEGLKRLGIKASQRPICILPEDFDWKFEDNKTLLLSFGLTKGAYATSLLRELVHYEEAVSE